jgi:hypothetical protein
LLVGWLVIRSTILVVTVAGRLTRRAECAEPKEKEEEKELVFS